MLCSIIDEECVVAATPNASPSNSTPLSTTGIRTMAYSSANRVNRFLLPIKVMLFTVISILLLIIAVCLAKSLYHKIKKAIIQSLRRRRIGSSGGTSHNTSHRWSSSRRSTGLEVSHSLSANLRSQQRLGGRISDTDLSVNSLCELFDPLATSPSAVTQVLAYDCESGGLTLTHEDSNLRRTTRVEVGIGTEEDESPPSYEEAMKLRARYKPVTFLQRKASYTCIHSVDASDARVDGREGDGNFSVTDVTGDKDCPRDKNPSILHDADQKTVHANKKPDD